jgi:serine phosphatase RsbU (regulator of sigma subunit)
MQSYLRQRLVESIMVLFLVLGAGLLGWHFYYTSTIIDQYRANLLDGGVASTERYLDAFFDPVSLSLALNRDRGAAGLLDDADTDEFNRVYRPVIDRNGSVSSILMADEDGNENMLLSLGGKHFLGRTTRPLGQGWRHSSLVEWEQQGDQLVHFADIREWDGYDPGARPWYKVGMYAPDEGVHWTAPYRFYTTHDLGITATARWTDKAGKAHVLAYDVMLADLSRFLYNAHPSPEGKAFLLTKDDLLLGVTDGNGPYLETQGDSAGRFISAEMDPPEVIKVREKWRSLSRVKNGFAVDLDGRRWGCVIVPYTLGAQVLKIGVMIPESDVLRKVRTIRIMLAIAGIVLILFGGVIIHMLHNNDHIRRSLATQNAALNSRTKELNESLTYAKYLQDATFPPSALVKSWFSQSFILNKPKETVGGDLYWMEPLNGSVLFAVADCTGHGVPGALVSMACINALDRSVRELQFTHPAEVLETTTQFVQEVFQRSANGMSDGMDICLCSLRYIPLQGNDGSEDGAMAILEFSGANRPLWVLRNSTGRIEVYGTDRLPVGHKGRDLGFTGHCIRLMAGDTIFLFTDGITDQFGGPAGRKFGHKALKELFISVRDLPMHEQGYAIVKALEEWRGDHEQIDDMCLMAVRINAMDRMVFSA